MVAIVFSTPKISCGLMIFWNQAPVLGYNYSAAVKMDLHMDHQNDIIYVVSALFKLHKF